MYEINERIKSVRKYLGLSQEQFTKRLGLTRGAISNIELHITTPKPVLINIICKEFFVNKEWLETGKGEMFSEPERDEEIARFVAKATTGRDNNIQRRLLALLSSMTDEEMEVMVRVMDRFSSTKEDKKEETGQ